MSEKRRNMKTTWKKYDCIWGISMEGLGYMYSVILDGTIFIETEIYISLVEGNSELRFEQLLHEVFVRQSSEHT